MSIVMTKQQKRDLNEIGFIVVHNVLSESEVQIVSGAIDEVQERYGKNDAAQFRSKSSFSLRNGVVAHDDILNLVDHPFVLGMVVDAVGWNIQNRDSVITTTIPQPVEEHKILSLGWHFDYEEEIAGMTIDGRLPLIDFKVGWYISDHRDPLHATILLVPGSHKWSPEKRASWEDWLDPKEIFELRVPAGSILLWRPSVLHSVTPNMSNEVRKAIYVSYCPRWIRPSGYVKQDPDLVARSSPVRRQLLGEMGDLSNPLGSNPKFGPNSQYWFTDDWNSVPLKAWAEEQTKDGLHDWGTELGVSHTKGPGYNFTQVNVPEGTTVLAN